MCVLKCLCASNRKYSIPLYATSEPLHMTTFRRNKFSIDFRRERMSATLPFPPRIQAREERRRRFECPPCNLWHLWTSDNADHCGDQYSFHENVPVFFQRRIDWYQDIASWHPWSSGLHLLYQGAMIFCGSHSLASFTHHQVVCDQLCYVISSNWIRWEIAIRIGVVHIGTLPTERFE